MKALVGAFKQEKAQVGAFSVIVKTLPMVRLQLYSSLLTTVTPFRPPRHHSHTDRSMRRQNQRTDHMFIMRKDSTY